MNVFERRLGLFILILGASLMLIAYFENNGWMGACCAMTALCGGDMFVFWPDDKGNVG